MAWHVTRKLGSVITGVVLWISEKFWEQLFERTPLWRKALINYPELLNTLKQTQVCSKKEVPCKYSRNTGKNGDGILVLAKLQCISYCVKEDVYEYEKIQQKFASEPLFYRVYKKDPKFCLEFYLVLWTYIFNRGNTFQRCSDKTIVVNGKNNLWGKPFFCWFCRRPTTVFVIKRRHQRCI